MASRLPAINARLDASILTSVPKPLHTERIRVTLRSPRPARTSKADISTLPIDLPHLKLGLLSQGTPLSKVRLDPLKVLEPTHKKLSTLEAQRILHVLNELRLKCDFIVILPRVIRDLSKYEELLGPELMQMLREHAPLLQNFQSLEKLYFKMTGETHRSIDYSRKHTLISDLDDSSPPATRGSTAFDPELLVRRLRETQVETIDAAGRQSATLPQSLLSPVSVEDPDKLQSVITQLNSMKMEIEFAIRNILRAFRDKEEILMALLAEAGGGKSREGSYFLQCLSELKDIIFERLLISPPEQHDKLHYLSQISAQDKNNQAVIVKLEEDLKAAVADKDKDIKSRNQVIQQLQVTLHLLEKATDDDIKRAKTESEKQSQADTRASQAKKYKLSSELKNLSYTLAAETNEHRDEEQLLRKKKYKIESEIENWIQKFDVEMGEKQKEYEEIDEHYQEEKKQLVELEKRFSVLETEYKEIMRVKLAHKESEEAKFRSLERQTRAAVTIQALWRASRVRKALALKQKQKAKAKRVKKAKKAVKRVTRLK